MRALFIILTGLGGIVLMGVGWHDHSYPARAVIYTYRWWLMIGGFFLFMIGSNELGAATHEASARSIAREADFALFRFMLRFPLLIFMWPFIKLAIGFGLAFATAQVIHMLAHEA